MRSGAFFTILSPFPFLSLSRILLQMDFNGKTLRARRLVALVASDYTRKLKAAGSRLMYLRAFYYRREARWICTFCIRQRLARKIKFHVSDETSVSPDDSSERNLRRHPFRNMLQGKLHTTGGTRRYSG